MCLYKNNLDMCVSSLEEEDALCLYAVSEENECSCFPITLIWNYSVILNVVASVVSYLLT